MVTGLYYVTHTIRILNHEFPETAADRASFIETFENVVSKLKRQLSQPDNNDLFLRLADN